LQSEQPDAIIHFTDPRFWDWLYQMEHEIRQQCPIIFYHLWDNLPFPHFNKNAYKSSDAIFAINKQTEVIVRAVDSSKTDWRLSYIPHGINTNIYKQLPKDDVELLAYKKKLFGDKEFDFVLFYNSRNIRRKLNLSTKKINLGSYLNKVIF